MKNIPMHGSLRKSGVEVEFVFFDDIDNEKQKGICEPRLYETGIAILPKKGEIVRIPFSDIDKVNEQDFELSITTEHGEKVVFSKMASKFLPWKKILSECMNEFPTKVQSYPKDLLSNADPLSIRKTVRYMKEGKAAHRSDIESISPVLCNVLENKDRIN